MAVSISDEHGLEGEHGDGLSLECPYCAVFSHMRLQSAPSASQLLKDKPNHIGVVYQCDACRAPVFLRFAVKEYHDDRVELYQNFVELERPKELLKIAETAQEKEQSPKLDVDGTTYYETKFIMNDQMIDEFLDEASDEVDHEGKTKS